MRDHDEVVRSALRDLRAADAQATPTFGGLLAPRPRPRSLDPWRMARVAVAAGLLIVAGVDGARRIEAWRTRLVVPAEVRELSAWRPMTDALLETPNARVLVQTPRMDESLLSITPILEDNQ